MSTGRPEAHVLDLHYFPAWDEHRADCSCGNVGSYLPTRAAAERDHARHVDEANQQ